MLAARPGSTETTVRAIVPRALTPVEGGACIQHFSWRLMWWLFAGFVWTHDPVVHNPSARRWTTPSIQAIMEAIVWYALRSVGAYRSTHAHAQTRSLTLLTRVCSPVLLIAGDKVPADWRFEERIKMLRSVRRLNLKGHHHLHIGTDIDSFARACHSHAAATPSHAAS